MVKNLFKILWNYKKLYLGVFIEQLCVFIMLMVSVISFMDAYKRYNDPGLLQTDDVVAFGYMQFNFQDPIDHRKLLGDMDVIIERLKKENYMTHTTRGFAFIPYLRSENFYYNDSIVIDNKKIRVNFKWADENSPHVFSPDIIEGEWFENKASEDGTLPVVITKQLAEKLEWDKSVGRTFKKFKVVGVISGIKENALTESPMAIIIPEYSILNNLFMVEYAAKVKKGYKEEFFDKFYKEYQSTIGQEFTVPILSDLNKGRSETMKSTVFEVAMYLIPTIFLFIFAFIGSLGLFSTVTKKRVGEYAVRIALGTTKTKIQGLIILESVIIATLACLPGIILGLFIYEISLFNILNILITFIIIIVFSIVSVLFSTRKVAKLEPAIILRQE